MPLFLGLGLGMLAKFAAPFIVQGIGKLFGGKKKPKKSQAEGPEGSTLEKFGEGALTASEKALGGAGKFFSDTLKDPTKTIAPGASDIGRTVQAGAERVQRGSARGGGASSVMAEAPFKISSGLNRLRTEAQNAAAGNLMKVGGAQGQLGLGAAQTVAGIGQREKESKRRLYSNIGGTVGEALPSILEKIGGIFKKAPTGGSV